MQLLPALCRGEPNGEVARPSPEFNLIANAIAVQIRPHRVSAGETGHEQRGEAAERREDQLPGYDTRRGDYAVAVQGMLRPQPTAIMQNPDSTTAALCVNASRVH
jgi:hypothetical protein